MNSNFIPNIAFLYTGYRVVLLLFNNKIDLVLKNCCLLTVFHLRFKHCSRHTPDLSKLLVYDRLSSLLLI